MRPLLRRLLGRQCGKLAPDRIHRCTRGRHKHGDHVHTSPADGASMWWPQ